MAKESIYLRFTQPNDEFMAAFKNKDLTALRDWFPVAPVYQYDVLEVYNSTKFGVKFANKKLAGDERFIENTLKKIQTQLGDEAKIYDNKTVYRGWNSINRSRFDPKIPTWYGDFNTAQLYADMSFLTGSIGKYNIQGGANVLTLNRDTLFLLHTLFYLSAYMEERRNNPQSGKIGAQRFAHMDPCVIALGLCFGYGVTGTNSSGFIHISKLSHFCAHALDSQKFREFVLKDDDAENFEIVRYMIFSLALPDLKLPSFQWRCSIRALDNYLISECFTRGLKIDAYRINKTLPIALVYNLLSEDMIKRKNQATWTREDLEVNPGAERARSGKSAPLNPAAARAEKERRTKTKKRWDLVRSATFFNNQYDAVSDTFKNLILQLQKNKMFHSEMCVFRPDKHIKEIEICDKPRDCTDGFKSDGDSALNFAQYRKFKNRSLRPRARSRSCRSKSCRSRSRRPKKTRRRNSMRRHRFGQKRMSQM